MAQSKTGDIHGLYRVFLGLVNTDGYNVGQAGTDIAEGTTATPYMMRYATEAAVSLPSRTTINFTGGDVWTGSFMYGFTSLDSFNIVSSTVDADLVALLSGSAVDETTNSLQAFFAENVMRSTPPQAWMMIIHRIQIKEAGQVGADKYISAIVPRCWIAPNGAQGQSFQSAGSYNYFVQPTVADKTPFGMPLTNMSLELGQTPVMWVITDFPPHFVTKRTTAAATTETINLPFQVATSGMDYSTPDSTAQYVTVYINDTQVDADSVDPATGAVVVSPISPATDFDGTEFISVFYETTGYRAYS